MAGFTTERWRVLSQYLDQVLDLDNHQREPWLASLRLKDPLLAADLEDLLNDREALDESGFLEGTANVAPPSPSLAGLRVGAYTLVAPIIVETDPPRLSDVAPNDKVYRGDLDNILAKALKKRPGER